MIFYFSFTFSFIHKLFLYSMKYWEGFFVKHVQKVNVSASRFKMKVYVFLSIAIAHLILNAESKYWALVVAGSNGWDNYRHQVQHTLFVLVHYTNNIQSRSVFRNLSNVNDGVFYENSKRVKAVNYFLKRLHQRSFK